MRIDLDPAALPPAREIPIQIESFAQQQGLKSTEIALKTRPDDTYWHLRHPKAKGTLEVTYYAMPPSLLIEVRKNRQGPWTTKAAEDLAQHLSRNEQI